MNNSKIWLNGNQLARKILENIALNIRKEQHCNNQFFNLYPKLASPHLSIINVGLSASSVSYIKKKIGIATSLGIKLKLHQFLERGYMVRQDRDLLRQLEKQNIQQNIDIKQFRFPYKKQRFQELSNLIAKLNYAPQISGILIELPLRSFRQEQGKQLTSMINPIKDVDCLTISNRAKVLEHSEPELIPCTPAGVLKILDEHNINLSGKIVIIAGRSSHVGLPLFHLLLNRNATITLCHTKTEDLDSMTAQADIVISAVGKPNIITKLKPGCVAIDVGVSVDRNGKLCGDISEEAKKEAYLSTPVPGGVGPLTTAMLMQNTTNLWLKQVKLKKQQAKLAVKTFVNEQQSSS